MNGRERPRILFLSQCLPWPPHSGVRARTFNILDQLRADFDVTLLAFSRRGHQRDERERRDATRALAGRLAHVAPPVPVAAEWRRARRVWDHLRSVAWRRPYTRYEYDHRDFRRHLRRALEAGAYTLAHLDSPDLVGWLPRLPLMPVTCTHHSIESQLLRRQAQQVGSRLLRRYVLWQAGLLETVEREICGRLTLNLMMSRLEAETLRALAPDARTLVVPNGVDVHYFAPCPGVEVTPGSVVFVGATHTLPNRDGVGYLLQTVWPLVRRAEPTASLVLLGEGTDAVWARLGRPEGVRALGYVPDVRPYLAQAACCVVPLRVGGGTRLKILDAWAMGKAVISTSLGCEGLDAVDGDNIVVRDQPEYFAAAVTEVLRHPDLARRLGANARATAEASYSWDVVGRGLRAAYWEIVTSAPRRARAVRLAVASRSSGGLLRRW